jgi:hypothetical protein
MNPNNILKKRVVDSGSSPIFKITAKIIIDTNITMKKYLEKLESIVD